MTTASIEAAAGRGNIASPDIDLKVELRRNIIPRFLTDVGDVSWRRKYGTVTVTAPTRQYNLPDDFFKMLKLFRNLGLSYTWTWAEETRPWSEIVEQWSHFGVGVRSGAYQGELPYIGEDPLLVAQAEANPQTGNATGYYIVQRTTTNLWKAVKLDNIPEVDSILPYVYLTSPQFADDTTSVELDPFILPEFQWGLVCGLRAEIFLDRFGRGDARYDRETERYEQWVMRAAEHKAQAPRNIAHFVS